MYRGGLDRFKKAQSLEPFSVSLKSAGKAGSRPLASSTHTQGPNSKAQALLQQYVPATTAEDVVPPPQQVTQVGGGQSPWQPPDWAIEPRPGVYYLEVLKDGEIIGRINLDKRRHIFGRQFPVCDFVLDHQSVSRQHAAVIPHKNGSIYVIDLGSAHGTFVANERLTKEIPVELEAGQSLKFAASTRTYILGKNTAALFNPPTLPRDLNLPSPPDPSDEEAVLAYNTILNRYGISKPNPASNLVDFGNTASITDDGHTPGRPSKRKRKSRVAFRDQMSGRLVEVVGVSDGADVDTEPGPLGLKEGSLVGKYESLVQVTVIPKAKEPIPPKEESFSPKGVTDKLLQVLNKVKNTPKGGMYDDLYGDSYSSKEGSSWAYKPSAADGVQKDMHATTDDSQRVVSTEKSKPDSSYDNDDLFDDDDL